MKHIESVINYCILSLISLKTRGLETLREFQDSVIVCYWHSFATCHAQFTWRNTYENYYIHIRYRHSIIWNADTFDSNTCLVLGSSLQTWIQVESTCSGNTDVETKLYKLKRNFIPFLQWRSHNHENSLSQILNFIYVHKHQLVSFCFLSRNSGNNINIEQQHQ